MLKEDDDLFAPSVSGQHQATRGGGRGIFRRKVYRYEALYQIFLAGVR